MEQMYCSLKNCNVTIWRDNILARSLEDTPNATISGRYCCSKMIINVIMQISDVR